VLREVTERTVGIEAATAKLVGRKRERMLEEVSRLLQDEEAYKKMATSLNRYGDGHASERIIRILLEEM
jgi:UDP-N-acetylglucosamine 2-epimerase (non-hydrolysing)